MVLSKNPQRSGYCAPRLTRRLTQSPTGQRAALHESSRSYTSIPRRQRYRGKPSPTASNHTSPQHLSRYVNAFAGHHDLNVLDTVHKMRRIAGGLVGKSMPYRMQVPVRQAWQA